jgi:hypothetical protein
MKIWYHTPNWTLYSTHQQCNELCLNAKMIEAEELADISMYQTL